MTRPTPALLCLHYQTPNGGPWIRCDLPLGHHLIPGQEKHYDAKHDQEWE